MNQIKCMHCEEIYEVQRGSCPKCGGRGGYMQLPKTKQLGELNVHLEEILIHVESGNEYQVKEIQANGLICKVVKCPLPVPDKPVYLSNTTIVEYKRK